MWIVALGTAIGVEAAANDARRWTALGPDVAAYVRTELAGDVSRVLPVRATRARRDIRTRLRYWLNSFRGFGVLDVRGDRA